MRGMEVCGKTRCFTAEEYATMASGLRDLAHRLEAYVDAIDKAEMEAD